MSSADNPKTVLLSGDPVQYEADIGGEAAIVPGHFVIYDSDGDIVAGAAETPRIVRERDFIGEGIDEEIPAGDRAPFYVGRRGDRFYAWVTDDVEPGDKLEADSDGKLQDHDQGVAIATAIESADGDSEPVRCRVEII